MNSERKKIPTTLYTEMTPNPGVLDFVCNRKIVDEKHEYIFNNPPHDSPLAVELFKFDYVKKITLHKNIISITKGGAVDWLEVTGELRDFIRLYLMDDKPVLSS